MADIRVKIAKDKAKLVKDLKIGEGSTGPFSTYYEVLVFAAVLGFRRKKFIPFEENADIDPIRQEQFDSKIINLLVLMHNRDLHILEKTIDSEMRKINIFEAYINGGLEVLKDILRGSTDVSNQILLLISSERKAEKEQDENFLDLDFLK
jgi:dnd system-associated protein 4